MEKQPEEINAVAVTHGLFQALRATPVIGRPFTADDSNPGPPVVILSHEFWRRRLGGTADVLERTLRLAGQPGRIIGVMPAGFRVLGRTADLYVPLAFNRASLRVTNFVFPGIGRLRPGVSPADATKQLQQIWPLAPHRCPGGLTVDQIRVAKIAPALIPLKSTVVGDVGRVLWVIFSGVAAILLVACANVASLLLVRSDGRRREYFIQSALGCSRLRAVGQVLAESALLGITGGMAGLGLAYAGLRLLVRIAPANLPRLEEIGLDPGALLFTVAVSLLAGLVPGLVVSAQAWRRNQSVALAGAGSGLGTGRARNRLRHALVVFQIASALVLLVASGLMVRSFVAMTTVDPGFSRGSDVLTFQITIPGTDVPDDEDVGAAYEALAGRLKDIPGVAAVGVTTSMPMDGRHGWDPIYFEDFRLPPKTPAPTYRFKWIGGGYAEAMGTRLVAGRPIGWEDVRQRARVVMITENLARQRWGQAAKAVGRRVSTGTGPGDWREIVGVLADVRDDGVGQDPVPAVFWPIAIEGFWREVRGDQLFVTRTAGYAIRSARAATPGFLDEVRRAVLSRRATRPPMFVRTMESCRTDSTARTSFLLIVLAIAAAVTLTLAVIGLFVVMSYVVGCRTREIGLRMAIGATRQSMAGLVLRQGALLTTVGVAVGLGASYGLTRLMRTALFGVAPFDPLTYVAGASILAASAIAAAYLPARRAARTDPYTALRAEQSAVAWSRPEAKSVRAGRPGSGPARSDLRAPRNVAAGEGSASLAAALFQRLAPARGADIFQGRLAPEGPLDRFKGRASRTRFIRHEIGP